MPPRSTAISWKMLNHCKNAEEDYFKEILSARIELYEKHLCEMSLTADINIIATPLLLLLS